MQNITFSPIGIIHSPHKKPTGIPIQSSLAMEINGEIRLFPEFSEGLKDLEGFSHLILIYHFHKSGKFKLSVKPFLDNSTHGVFCTRAPVRPNPIGISIVKLVEIKGLSLFFKGNDILDQTPLLDIKPYVTEFDAFNDCLMGWYEDVKEKEKEKEKKQSPLSDDRFISKD